MVHSTCSVLADHPQINLSLRKKIKKQMLMPKVHCIQDKPILIVIINVLPESPSATKETKQVREANNGKTSCKMSCDS